MNYIKQLNAFYDSLLLNPLTPKEQSLYLAILNLNNKAGWKREFTIANQTLQAICSISKSELHKLRNKLEQKGLIEYKKGNRTQAGKYKIGFLYETQVETQAETQVETQMGTKLETQTETQVEDITKHKLNKTNNGQHGGQSKGQYTDDFESFWSCYPRKVGKKEAYAKWKARIKQGECPDKLILASENYAKECERDRTEQKFIKHAKTFLSDKQPYEDYIEVQNVVQLHDDIDHDDFIRRKCEWIENGGDEDEYDFARYREEVSGGG